MEVRLTDAPLLSCQLALANTNRDHRLDSARFAQEQLLYTDVLRVVVGCSGTYIRRVKRAYNGAVASFSVDPSIDMSLEHAIAPLLELARNHEVAAQYAGELSGLAMGRVNHALGGAISSVCAQLVSECAALDTQPDFGLQDLVFALRSQNRKFEHLSNLVEDLRADQQQGGAVLAVLSRKLEIVRGSELARDMMQTLIQRASQPFLDMLGKWIHHGQIDDPFNEFFVMVDDKELTLAEDWEKFRIDYSKIPFELQNPEVYRQVLRAGKYLNVDGVCDDSDGTPSSSSSPCMPSTVLDTSLLVTINDAYASANGRLLRLVLTRELRDKLSTFKHTFFLDNTDFLPAFLVTAARELHKPVASASLRKLQYALDMAIQQPGSISSEQRLDDLKVSLASTGLLEELLSIANVSGVTAEQLEALGDGAVQISATASEVRDSLTALQALQFDFDIDFPMNLIISRNTIVRYQFLFRLLLKLRTCINGLNDAWSHQTKSVVWRHKGSAPLEALKSRCTKLRVRVIHLLQTLLYYSTTSVIEENWKVFNASLDRCASVDALERDHLYFLDKCLKECMLTKSPILTVLDKLFRDVRLFTLFIVGHERTLFWICPFQLPAGLSFDSVQQTPAELEAFMEECIDKYDKSYSKHVAALIEELRLDQENTALRGLLMRL